MNLEEVRNRYLLAREKYIKEELMYGEPTVETFIEFQEASSDIQKLEKEIEEENESNI